MAAIFVENLRKTYGDLVALDGVSFEVRQGEIFGMVQKISISFSAALAE